MNNQVITLENSLLSAEVLGLLGKLYSLHGFGSPNKLLGTVANGHSQYIDLFELRNLLRQIHDTTPKAPFVENEDQLTLF